MNVGTTTLGELGLTFFQKEGVLYQKLEQMELKENEQSLLEENEDGSLIGLLGFKERKDIFVYNDGGIKMFITKNHAMHPLLEALKILQIRYIVKAFYIQEEPDAVTYAVRIEMNHFEERIDILLSDFLKLYDENLKFYIAMSTSNLREKVENGEM